MGQAGRVGPNASHRWGVRNRRTGPVGPVRMRADAMRLPAGDALVYYLSSHVLSRVPDYYYLHEITT
jgi:hypothetical protein